LRLKGQHVGLAQCLTQCRFTNARKTRLLFCEQCLPYNPLDPKLTSTLKDFDSATTAFASSSSLVSLSIVDYRAITAPQSLSTSSIDPIHCAAAHTNHNNRQHATSGQRQL
jgi:hypothetical protein